MMHLPIHTERLLLRQWQDSDYAPFAELNADPQVMEYFPACKSQEESNEQADAFRGLIAERGWGFWAVELKATGAFIGMVGLLQRFPDTPFAGEVEVGWRLAKDYWGRGYATEAARTALRIGFEDLGLEEIMAITARINRPSRAVMEKLGMQREAGSFEYPTIPVGNPVREHVCYRLSREVWMQNQQTAGLIDEFSGSWSDEEAETLNKEVERLRNIDDEIWR